MSQAASLSLTLKEYNGRTVLCAEGEIDIATVPAFSSALDTLGREQVDVVLDLAGVEFIDSSGLHALVDTARILASSQRKVVIINPHPAVIRALDVAGLLSKFIIEKLD